MGTDWWGVVMGGAGMVVGITGLVFAKVADRRAKDANQIARAANELSADALAEARRANEVAEDANQLSQDANTVIGRQADREAERWFVDWSVKWDADRNALIFKNLGSHNALDVSVVIQANALHESRDSLGDVAAPGQFEIEIPEIFERRGAFNIKERERLNGLPSYVISPGRTFKLTSKIVVTWSTGLGRPESQTLEVELR